MQVSASNLTDKVYLYDGCLSVLYIHQVSLTCLWHGTPVAMQWSTKPNRAQLAYI